MTLVIIVFLSFDRGVASFYIADKSAPTWFGELAVAVFIFVAGTAETGFIVQEIGATRSA